MSGRPTRLAALAALAALATLGLGGALAATGGQPAQEHRLDSLAGLHPRQMQIEVARYRGRRALHMVNAPGARGETYAWLAGTRLEDGTIEVDVAGQPQVGARPGMRGFVGVVFRLADDLSHFECFYLRPTNGRADDQLRRNHSTQYISFPDFPWERLRSEAPGVYESYVDLVPGAWTHLRIDVHGQSARLYVDRAPQPALVVNDLKRPASAGAVGLWEGAETDGYFSRLVIRPRPPGR